MSKDLSLIRAPLEGLTAFRNIKSAIKEKNYPISLTGCLESEMCHMIDGLSYGVKWRVIITSDDLKARAIYEDYKFFDNNVYLYPALDIIFYSANVHGNAIQSKRLRCIEAIMSGEGGTVITTLSAGIELIQSLERYKSSVISIRKGEDLSIEDFRRKLTDMGYERNPMVQAPGEFSIRGGIIDIYPPSSDCPYRVELFDTQIDTLRSFDIESQRSIEEVDCIDIFPASQIILSDDEIEKGLAKITKDADKLLKTLEGNIKAFNNLNSTVRDLRELVKLSRAKTGLEVYLPYFDTNTCSIFDYFDFNETLFFVDDISLCIEQTKVIEEEFIESMNSRYQSGYVLKKQFDILIKTEKLIKNLLLKPLINLSMINSGAKVLKPRLEENVNVMSLPSYSNHFDYLISDLKSWKSKGYKCIILSASHTRGKRLAKELQDFDVDAFYRSEPEGELKFKQIMVTYGALKKGFLYPTLKLVIVSESDIYGLKIERKKAKKKKNSANIIKSFSELSIGDYVIHENHGMAVYRGIEKKKIQGTTRDYVKLCYADDGKLFVPVDNLDVLQKYSDKEGGKAPKLDNLSSREWSKKKARVKAHVRDIAKDLLELYSQRQKLSGYRFSPDTVWQAEFEELFPFEETDDQLEAIKSIKADMESDKIMDRLICGDVGFGKTEVALRAIFKCVNDGKQAVMLAPTTILANQHYNTFKERIGDFPIKVELLSRFRTAAQNRETIKKLKSGEVDIVVGTHRVLSKDVTFKDLGLLVVDEEQRFGVTHKEKIKVLKKNVDVITLSATPIPRTLHMSLVGIRDMNLLEEPPVDRMPIQTFVMEKNDETIKDAVNREVTRGGQVYYVYNRIDNIAEVAVHLSKLLPEVRIEYAHGRMTPAQLEKIMMNFVAGEIDVLLSTTIIETGLDIPNVNTIIIDNADKMGLSQLYQLRGRVGRSNRMAYAFIMYRKDKVLSEVASKRLSAIREFTALGSGVRIAMRDLEIRGAGNVIGAEQSGHMGEVGYDLYCKLLEEAIKQLKSTMSLEEADIYDFETTIDIRIDAYIPATYIKSEFIKLEMYKKISCISTEEDYTDMEEELTDRFGKIPKEVSNLLKVAYIRNLSHQAFVSRISREDDKIKIFINRNNKISSNKLLEMIKSYKKKLKYVPGDSAYLLYTKQRRHIPGKPIEKLDDEWLFKTVLRLIKDLTTTLED